MVNYLNVKSFVTYRTSLNINFPDNTETEREPKRKTRSSFTSLLYRTYVKKGARELPRMLVRMYYAVFT